MKLLRGLTGALLAAAVLAGTGTMAASTTNYSDQWWIEAEAGWGASVLQQHDVLFIDLFVYDANSRPTWFTAAAYLQPSSPAGHTVFTGDLNRTTGPYYGGPFDRNAVTLTRVGTLTFDATSATTAVMTYVVDGTQVVKNVTRQLWRYENIGGIYVGGMADDEICGGQPSQRVSDHVMMDITHGTDNVVTISLQIISPDEPTMRCTIAGVYSQSGHLGQIPGATMQCPGVAGTATLNFFEIERSAAGLLARYNATLQTPEGSCTLSNGTIGGVRKQ